MEYLLGIDVGTSSTKVLVVDREGRPVAEASRDYGLSRPKPHWVEQDPRDWWRAAQEAVREALERGGLHPTEVVGVGLAGQTPTAVFVDEDGEPVRPAIIWQDNRAAEEAQWLAQEVGAERMEKYLGIALPLNGAMPPAKLLWLARHEPEALEATYKTLQPKDYINLKLTGRALSNAWDSKGMLHLRDHTVSQEYFDLLGVPSRLVPEVIAPWEVGGRVSAEAARATGLAEGTPVVAGLSDALSSMLATGALGQESCGFDIGGTSEIVGLPSFREQVGPVPELVIIPGFIMPRPIVYGPTQTSGACLEWFIGSFMPEAGAEGYEVALGEAGAVEPGAGGLVFLPYLQGERAPRWDEKARGIFFGLSLGSGRGHLARAVLEGVAYSVRHVLEIAERGAGQEARVVRLAGGPARNPLWNRIKADVLGRRVEVMATPETATLGATMLAGVGVGLAKDLSEVSRRMVRIEMVLEPDPEAHGEYDKLYETYLELYPHLKSLF